MSTVFSRSILSLIFLGCAPADNATDSSSDEQGGADQAVNPTDVPSDDVSTTVLFDVAGVPYDITETPNGILYVSIAENGIVVWDPAVNWPETLTERAGSIFGIEWHDGDIYYTTSVHRQEGALLRLDGNTGEVLATASGDVIFREPTDLCRAPDDTWVLTDKTVQALFVVDGSEITMRESGVTEPSTIACDETHVYIGGADGISRIAWPNGTPEKIDDRAVNGLHIFDGELLGSNSEWGVFRVPEGNRMGFDTMRIPGRMAGSTQLYVTDWANSGVWSTSD